MQNAGVLKLTDQVTRKGSESWMELSKLLADLDHDLGEQFVYQRNSIPKVSHAQIGEKRDKGRSYNGAWVYPKPDTKKSPALAAFLGFLWLGAGQIYLGQTKMGTLFAVIGLISYIFTLGGIYIVLMIVLGIRLMIEAYKDAKSYNKGEPLKDSFKDLPPD